MRIEEMRIQSAEKIALYTADLQAQTQIEIAKIGLIDRGNQHDFIG
jgi:hypothetical protein